MYTTKGSITIPKNSSRKGAVSSLSKKSSIRLDFFAILLYYIEEGGGRNAETRS
jgi:hypothetical protein